MPTRHPPAVPHDPPPAAANHRARNERDPREVGGRWSAFQHHSSAGSSPDLAAFVSGYWFARWDLRGQPPYHQLTVPYPQVHLSFGYETVPVVRGVTRGHVVRMLRGAGWVFGVAFRPGCFRPFLGRPVATITSRSLPADQVFGPNIPHRAMAEADDQNERVQVVERFLRTRQPAPDAAADLATAIVQCIATDPTLTRVDALADTVDLSIRQLQRLFAEHVGISPKHVIRRYRLHEVTRRLDDGPTVDWAALAAELGYADQAHLTRDFAAVFGEPPTRYADRYPI
nr:AraC family transcriptional regulator [uncultured bacterium]